MKLRIGSRKWAAAAATLIAGTAIAVGYGGSSAAASSSSSVPHSGGSLTVLESSGNAGFGVWPTGLDPSSDTTGPANQSYMDAIFGELFELGPGGKTVPDLATSYRYESGGTKVVINLRTGVKFSDGTPFNAAAVVYNINRDLKATCTCKPTWPVSSVTASGAHTVVIALTAPDGALINQLQDDPANWIASPTAIGKTSAQAFALKPVGAGPFEVVNDTLSTKLVLRRNPSYWQKGRPYLNNLTFTVTATDETALEAIEAGQAQAYEDMSTPALVSSYKGAHLTTTAEPSTSPFAIQLNTTIAPFNNIAAREALYYATNPQQIDTHLFGDKYAVVQSFASPLGLFYEPKVPGYRTYNLTKAKALVKSLGGLTFNMFSVQAPVDEQVLEALQAQWAQAGINVTINQYALGGLVQQFESKQWEAALSPVGSWDPGSNDGIALYFSSLSPFSGVSDTYLNTLLNAGQSTVGTAARKHIYDEIAGYISKEAYAPFLFPISTWNIATPGVQGPGLTNALPETIASPQVLWEDVWMAK